MVDTWLNRSENRDQIQVVLNLRCERLCKIPNEKYNLGIGQESNTDKALYWIHIVVHNKQKLWNGGKKTNNNKTLPGTNFFQALCT